jgi:hypothetical protein
MATAATTMPPLIRAFDEMELRSFPDRRRMSHSKVLLYIRSKKVDSTTPAARRILWIFAGQPGTVVRYRRFYEALRNIPAKKRAQKSARHTLQEHFRCINRLFKDHKLSLRVVSSRTEQGAALCGLDLS